MSKIRILQFGMTPNIGGIETYLYQQFIHLKGSDIIYDFVNFFPDKIAFSDTIEKMNGKIYCIPARGKKPLLHYYELFRFMYKHHSEYKAVVLNSLGLYYIYPLLLAKIFGIPIRIIHSHNAGYEIKMNKKNRLLIRINKAIYNKCVTHRWACSNLAGIWMFGNRDFTVIPNAIDVEKFRFNDNIRKEYREKLGIKEEFAICHIGRFSPQKNQSWLIDFFYELQKDYSNLELFFVGGVSGDGDTYFLDNAKRKVEKLKIEDKVKFLGMRKDVAELMQAMDCFILPSHFEGLGIVGVEAQATGLPCYFSLGVPKDICLTDNAKFIQLDNIDKSKTTVKIERTMDRSKYANLVSIKGYDINDAIKKIINFYRS